MLLAALWYPKVKTLRGKQRAQLAIQRSPGTHSQAPGTYAFLVFIIGCLHYTLGHLPHTWGYAFSGEDAAPGHTENH